MTVTKPNHQRKHNSPTIFERSWMPEGPCKAVVIIVHGFTEHSGRYEYTARALNAHGLAIHAMDLRGHGQSEGARAWVESFDEYLDDVEPFVARVREANRGKRLFLLGHSMGGVVATLLIAERRAEVDGLILSAAALKVSDDVFPLLRRLAILFSRIWPTLRIARMGCRRLSRDPANVERFRADPLVFHRAFPVRTGAEILAAGDRTLRQAAAIQLPLLVLQGTADGVVNPAGSRQLYDQAASPDKSLRMFEGLYHDLFGEPEKDRVIRLVAEWIDERCLE